MNKLNLLLILITCTLDAGFALAGDEEVQMLKKAKISLVQAIKIAESHQGGQAFEAEIEDDSFNPEYEVKVLKDDRKFKVTIDGISGEVTRVKEK